VQTVQVEASLQKTKVQTVHVEASCQNAMVQTVHVDVSFQCVKVQTVHVEAPCQSAKVQTVHVDASHSPQRTAPLQQWQRISVVCLVTRECSWVDFNKQPFFNKVRPVVSRHFNCVVFKTVKYNFVLLQV
jgi:hypothetical protein